MSTLSRRVFGVMAFSLLIESSEFLQSSSNDESSGPDIFILTDSAGDTLIDSSSTQLSGA